MIFFRKETLIVLILTMTSFVAYCAENLPTPPDVWKDFDPDKGDFKEEIVKEETKGGIYYKESYISAYVLGDEIRVYCKYSVKAGAKNAPGLMNVHGWYAMPNIPIDYVKEGWAVLAHDYAGKLANRKHYTKYPEKLTRGNMAPAPIWTKYRDGKQITDPKEPSEYIWNAIQRRALSYLIAQKEVDKKRIGARGFSYGGTIMWNLGMDPRVKAVVAYFGIGWNNYYRGRRVWKYNNPYTEPEKTQAEKIWLAAVAPQAHCPYITAATLWLNGSNDHHGGHERGMDSFKMFKPGVPWDFAVQARGHHNTEKLGNDCKLWLEKYVLNKDIFWPARPKSELKLDADGVPELHLTPASPERIKELQVYKCLKTANNIERNWRDVKSVRQGNTWIAKLPVVDINDYVFSYANIRYKNDCVVSSDFEAAIPAKLGKAVATEKKSNLLPEGVGQWNRVAPAEGPGGVKGFRPVNNRFGADSKQFADPKYSAPRGADLNFMFYCTQPQKIVLAANRWFVVDIDITASDKWQSKSLKIGDLKIRNDGRSMKDWSEVKHLLITPQKGSDLSKVVFAKFKWSDGKNSKSKTETVPQAKSKAVAAKTDPEGKVYLTKEMAAKTQSFWRVMNDKSIEGKKKISIGKKEFDKGLGVHAPSEITFNLDSKYKSFHVVPGPDDAHKGTIEMKILVDGKEVYTSGKVNRHNFEAKALDIPVKEAKKLTLIVTEADGNRGGDHASWGDAFLVK